MKSMQIEIGECSLLLQTTLKKLAVLAVREDDVSRHNGGSIKGATWTSQYDSTVMYGSPQLGTYDAERCSRHNEGPIKGSSWTPQHDRVLRCTGALTGPHDAKRRQAFGEL